MVSMAAMKEEFIWMTPRSSTMKASMISTSCTRPITAARPEEYDDATARELLGNPEDYEPEPVPDQLQEPEETPNEEDPEDNPEENSEEEIPNEGDPEEDPEGESE